MTLTETQPKTYKAEVGWCRKHEGIHQRRNDCEDYRFNVELIACDAHGEKPHRQTGDCSNVHKADPFHGF
jgi:hypothetical protein